MAHDNLMSEEIRSIGRASTEMRAKTLNAAVGVRPDERMPDAYRSEVKEKAKSCFHQRGNNVAPSWPWEETPSR